MTDFDWLIERARAVLAPRQIARNAFAGSVAAAMVAAGESRILKAVAVGKSSVFRPAGTAASS
ncbi:MAG: hypothetical protein LBD02_05570 [Christensenellaceae bacterium]|jgi:hypothetical protein|nr:hypothetical protein [Christensenellaceae bacterium]